MKGLGFVCIRSLAKSKMDFHSSAHTGDPRFPEEEREGWGNWLFLMCRQPVCPAIL